MRNTLLFLCSVLVSCGVTTKRITVITEPAGAMIEFNDAAVGYAPISFEVKFQNTIYGVGYALNTIRAIPAQDPFVEEFARKLLIDDKVPPEKAMRQLKKRIDNIRDMSADEYVEFTQTIRLLDGVPRAIAILKVQAIHDYIEDIKNMVDYLDLAYGAANLDDYLETYGESTTQYTQTKIMTNEEIVGHEDLVLYFDMNLKPIPNEYEFRIK